VLKHISRSACTWLGGGGGWGRTSSAQAMPSWATHGVFRYRPRPTAGVRLSDIRAPRPRTCTSDNPTRYTRSRPIPFRRGTYLSRLVATIWVRCRHFEPAPCGTVVGCAHQPQWARTTAHSRHQAPNTLATQSEGRGIAPLAHLGHHLDSSPLNDSGPSKAAGLMKNIGGTPKSWLLPPSLLPPKCAEAAASMQLRSNDSVVDPRAAGCILNLRRDRCATPGWCLQLESLRGQALVKMTQTCSEHCAYRHHLSRPARCFPQISILRVRTVRGKVTTHPD
jgi:hypothetical protein